jgi:hypothetical protein
MQSECVRKKKKEKEQVAETEIKRTVNRTPVEIHQPSEDKTSRLQDFKL